MKQNKTPLTVQEVVSLAKRLGVIEVNPLRYRKWRGCGPCFDAANRGLLRKERISCARFRFYPV